jgi:hypothetical protein
MAQIAVLLGDIKMIFAEKGEDKITSADLVETLVKIEGHPWAEMGRNRRPPGHQQIGLHPREALRVPSH